MAFTDATFTFFRLYANQIWNFKLEDIVGGPNYQTGVLRGIGT